jgi:hypothetical protein
MIVELCVPPFTREGLISTFGFPVPVPLSGSSTHFARTAPRAKPFASGSPTRWSGIWATRTDGASKHHRSCSRSAATGVDGGHFGYLRKLPFLERKAALARLLRDTEAGILLNEHIAGDGLTVFAHACQLGASWPTSQAGAQISGCPLLARMLIIVCQFSRGANQLYCMQVIFPIRAPPKAGDS